MTPTLTTVDGKDPLVMTEKAGNKAQFETLSAFGGEEVCVTLSTQDLGRRVGISFDMTRDQQIALVGLLVRNINRTSPDNRYIAVDMNGEVGYTGLGLHD